MEGGQVSDMTISVWIEAGCKRRKETDCERRTRRIESFEILHR